MRKSLTALGALALVGLVVTIAGGDTPKANEADEAAIKKAITGYADALTKGDVQAVVSHWTNDAEFIDESGTVTKGRKALGDLFAQGLANAKGAKYTISVKSVRFPVPGVAMVEADIDSSVNGANDLGRVSAVWVKDKDRWMITSARDLPDEAASSAMGKKAVEEMAWLIGEWISEEKTNPIKVSARYVLDKHFILVDYAIPQADGTTVTVAQMIGFDPATESLASWTFDSRGGNGVGVWSRSGNTWTGEVEGVMADGRVGSGKLRIKYRDDKSFVYDSFDREVDGQPVADASVKYTKKTN
ncbi:MAG: SgcJ/EcaC family oxidoreductase [Gemmataceae bacterium]